MSEQEKKIQNEERECTRLSLVERNKAAANAMLLRMLSAASSALASEVSSITVGVTVYE